MGVNVLEEKTIEFSVDIVEFTDRLRGGRAIDVMARQLVRSGTSVSANYRSAMRAKSTASFVHKLSIVEEEADESMHWLKLLVRCKKVTEDEVSSLHNLANEIVAMTVASIKTAKKKQKRKD